VHASSLLVKKIAKSRTFQQPQGSSCSETFFFLYGNLFFFLPWRGTFSCYEELNSCSISGLILPLFVYGNSALVRPSPPPLELDTVSNHGMIPSHRRHKTLAKRLLVSPRTRDIPGGCLFSEMSPLGSFHLVWLAKKMAKPQQPVLVLPTSTTTARIESEKTDPR
jgi:hypothetical protein